MILKFPIFYLVLLIFISCKNVEKRICVIFPDEHLNNKQNMANASLISFLKLDLKEVLIYGGEYTYVYKSEENIEYQIKFEHVVNYFRNHDQYYDPDYTPGIKQHKVLKETYSIDSCEIIAQLEFGIASIKATPQKKLRFTEKEVEEIQNQFKTTTFEKYENYNSSNKFIEPIIKDTIIKNIHMTTSLNSDGRKILNSYFMNFEIDSIYSIFWNDEYFKTILSNGDIVNIYDSKPTEPELLRQYIYMDSSKDECIGCCGVGHINDRIACIYINN